MGRRTNDDMGTMGLRFGVVATLGALAACNGRYEVGSGEGGAAGELSETGGSSGGGQGASGPGTGGGSTETGGTGSGTGGTGGTSTDTGGTSAAGTGGSNVGGGGSSCHAAPPESLPEYTPAAPAVVWQRNSRFLYDEEREIDVELPEETTTEWVETFVGSILDAHHDVDGGGLDGLAKFFDVWFGVEAGIDWSPPLSSPFATFGPDLLLGERSPSGRTLFEDRAFLEAYPRAALRGAWLAKNLFCTDVGLPPVGTSEPPPAPGPSETGRMVLEAQTSSPTCHGCHSYIDPLGFSLEHYDEAGQFRETDNGLPVDSSGTFNFDPHGQIAFVDDRDLVMQVALTCEVGFCFSSAFLDYAVAQAHEGEAPEISAVERQHVLAALFSEYHRLRPMLLAVVTTPSFLKE